MSICTTLLSAYSFKSLGYEVDWWYSSAIAICTLVLYNYYFLFALERINLLKWLKTNRPVLLIGMIVTLLTIFFWRLRLTSIFFLFVAFLLCLLYFKPNLLHAKSLRENSWLKFFLISIVFSIVTQVIPLLQINIDWTELLALGLSRVFFIAAIAITFDIGDLFEDISAATPTLPALHGSLVTKVFASLFLFFSAIIESYFVWNYLLDFPSYMALMITYIFTWILIMRSTKYKSKYFYLFGLDGMLGLPFIISQL